MPSCAAQFSSLLDVDIVLGVGPVDDPGIPARQMDVVLGGNAGLQLAAAFDLGIQLGTEQQRQIGDPQPEREDDHTGQRAVGLS